jgi:hypothetical protein
VGVLRAEVGGATCRCVGIAALDVAVPAPAGTSDEGAARPGTGERPVLTRIVLGALLAFQALGNGGALTDADGAWHRRTGQLILDTGSIPRHDPFSWTALGAPWHPNAWLSDLVFALLQRMGGLASMSILRAVVVVAFGLAIHAGCRRAGAGRWSSVFVAWAATLCLDPFVSERPQLFSFLLLPLVLWLAARPGKRPLVGLGVAFALWAGLHGVFVVGVGVVGLTVLGRWLDDRRPEVLRRGLAVGAVAALAPLATPFLWKVYTNAFHVRSVSDGIAEYANFTLSDGRDQVLAVFALGVVYGLWRTGRWRRFEVVLPIAALTVATYDAIRNAPLLLVVGAAEVALGLSAAPAPRTRALAAQRAGELTTAMAIVAGLLALMAVPTLGRAGEVDAAGVPVRAIAAIPSGCKLFNDYNLGGWVIERRPDVPVSEDGRNDMYGTERLRPQFDLMRGEVPAEATLDAMGVDCVLVQPDRELTAALRESPAWREAVTDPTGVLFLRT